MASEDKYKEDIDKIKKLIKDSLKGFEGEIEIEVGQASFVSDVSYRISNDLKNISFYFYSYRFPASFYHYAIDMLEEIAFKMNTLLEKRKLEEKIKEMEQVIGSDQDLRELLSDFEKKIREFIKRTLSKHYDNWWEEVIPIQYQKNAMERLNREKTADQKRGIFDRDYDLLEFLDFSVYEEIIFSKKNYKYFKSFFEEKNILQALFREISRLRNLVFHHRTNLRKQDIVIGKDYIKRILGIINFNSP